MWKKPLWMLSIFVPVKKKALRENYRKFLISLPWKKKPTREKILRSVRENFRPPVKNSKKVCVKFISHPWKKSKKGKKKLSRAILIFTGKKISADPEEVPKPQNNWVKFWHVYFRGLYLSRYLKLKSILKTLLIQIWKNKTNLTNKNR